MTKFDIVVAVLLLISAAIGYARGAIREIAAMVALVIAAILAIWTLPATASLARHLIHTRWIAALVALACVFLITYALLRLLGTRAAQRVQKAQVLGALDRSLGLGIGLVRGFVVMGGLYLMFNAATPRDLRPHWITGSVSWPVAARTAHVLTELAPKGLDAAGRLKPAFDRAVKGVTRDRNAANGYDARQRREIDDLVEKSR